MEWDEMRSTEIISSRIWSGMECDSVDTDTTTRLEPSRSDGCDRDRWASDGCTALHCTVWLAGWPGWLWMLCAFCAICHAHSTHPSTHPPTAARCRRTEGGRLRSAAASSQLPIAASAAAAVSLPSASAPTRASRNCKWTNRDTQTASRCAASRPLQLRRPLPSLTVADAPARSDTHTRRSTDSQTDIELTSASSLRIGHRVHSHPPTATDADTARRLLPPLLL